MLTFLLVSYVKKKKQSHVHYTCLFSNCMMCVSQNPAAEEPIKTYNVKFEKLGNNDVARHGDADTR